MLVLGIIFSIFGLGALICLLFTLAIYALPFFVAVTAGMAAFHSGAGVIGAILVAAFVGGATLAIGQIVFATVRSPAIRGTVALLHAVPATIAGYSATHGLAEFSVPSATWQMIFAVIGAICVGCTAFVRLAMLAPPVIGQGFRCLRPRRGFRTAPGGVKHAAFDEKLIIGRLSGHFWPLKTGRRSAL